MSEFKAIYSLPYTETYMYTRMVVNHSLGVLWTQSPEESQLATGVGGLRG